jgi:hypothetical protein
MAGIIVVDRIESDASYASSINIASPVIVSNTFAFPAGSNTAPAITPSGDNNTGIFFPAADTIAFAEGGTEAMRLTSAGDMGVGTTSPGCKFQVNGLIRATSLTNPTSGSGVELGYDGTQGVIQAFSDRVTNTSVPINIVGDLKMNSGYGSSAIAYGCRAWVNFNGTGTVAIRSSGNVSSITDNGAAEYTVNFTTAMPDANYAMTAIAGGTGGGQAMMVSPGASGGGYGGQTTTSCRFTTWTWNVSLNDASYVTAAFFR